MYIFLALALPNAYHFISDTVLNVTCNFEHSAGNRLGNLNFMYYFFYSVNFVMLCDLQFFDFIHKM